MLLQLEAYTAAAHVKTDAKKPEENECNGEGEAELKFWAALHVEWKGGGGSLVAAAGRKREWEQVYVRSQLQLCVHIVG